MSATKTYILKAMVIARGLAELTVLAILSIAPFVLMGFGLFNKLDVVVRFGLVLLSPLSMWGIWLLAQVPYKIVLSDSGLDAVALLKRWNLHWSNLKMMKQSSRVGFRQYVITHSGGELSFPCLFSRTDELLEQIRSKLPNRGRSTTGDAQIFRMPRISFYLELGKLILQAGFALIFFFFYFSLLKGGKSSQEDMAVVLIAAIAFSGAVLWKSVQTFRLPHEVKVDKDGLLLSGPFGRSQMVSWNEIESLESLSLLFPDGKGLRVRKQRLLLGSSLDGFDELCEEISRRTKSTPS